jgi:hypothetical protein
MKQIQKITSSNKQEHRITKTNTHTKTNKQTKEYVEQQKKKKKKFTTNTSLLLDL